MDFMVGPYSDKTYIVVPHEIRGSVKFESYAQKPRPVAWGNCEFAMPLMRYGVSLSTPNYCKPFNEVVGNTVTQTGCEVVSYVYEVFDPITHTFLGWYPQSPTGTWIACLALGVRESRKASSHTDAGVPWIVVTGTNTGSIAFAVKWQHAAVRPPTVAEIYDVRGRMVATVAGSQHADDVVFRWAGRSATGATVADGVYIFVVSAAGARWTREFSLSK
jgi:hypothetical protein